MLACRPRGLINIVDGLDFEVRTGQIFGLAGEEKRLAARRSLRWRCSDCCQPMRGHPDKRC